MTMDTGDMNRTLSVLHQINHITISPVNPVTITRIQGYYRHKDQWSLSYERTFDLKKGSAP
jgi:hypothetical protein